MFRWTAGLLLLGLLLVVLATYVLLRQSLPVLDGDLVLQGLSSPVRVERDALGTVTITARDQHDAVRALGYVHAQERYFEMDLMRRSSAGELAALFGPAALDLDKRRRVHRMRQRVRDHIEQFTHGQRQALDAYVEGVNSGLSSLDSRPWPYLLIRQVPEPWTVEDVALTGFAMYFDLQDSSNASELALWQIRPHLPAPLWQLVTHDGSEWDAPIIGMSRGNATLPGNDAVDLRRLAHPDPKGLATTRLPDRPALGSNNFAVSGAMSPTGSAIVADDMHLGLRAPNIWFRARLKYPDPEAPGGQVDATGFTLPGLPAIVVGSNRHVAWAFTNSYGDWLDWQELPACSDGESSAACPTVTRITERIEIAGQAPGSLEIEETAWGPILHHAPDGRRLALRWVAHQPGALTIGLMDFVRADSVGSALDIANRSAIPAQNLLVGDIDGNIAWRLLGPLPERSPTCTASPSAAESDAALNPPDACAPWSLVPADGVSVRSPADGRLWTANSRVVDGDLLAKVGDGGYVLGARARQIRDDLNARQRFDEQSLLDIQLDDRAIFLQRWWVLLQAQAEEGNSPALMQLADTASTRPERADVDSVSYRLVRGWRQHVQERIADGLTGPAQVALGEDFRMPGMPQLEGVAWPLVTQQPAHLLPPRFDSWQALFEDAAMQLRDELQAQGPLSERSWGERNAAHICHPLYRALPRLTKPWLCMPATPLPGDSHMPRVQSPDMGASERMVVSPGHEEKGIAHMPGGQSGHVLSPFWGSGHDDWVHGRATPFLPGDTLHTLTLAPTPD